MNSSGISAFANRLLKNRVLTHVVFWVLMSLLYSKMVYRGGIAFWDQYLLSVVLFPSIIASSYWLVYYQLPRQFYTKRYVVFGFTLILNIYLSLVLARILTVYVAETILGMEGAYPGMILNIFIQVDRLFTGYLLTLILGIALMVTIKVMKNNMEQKRKAERLEQEKRTAELNFLKAQIHPHFLFNTLNNLYTLTLQKSDEAPKTVIMLSEMLDYMLYQCNDKQVPIHKEIQLLNNYIDLERLRYGDRLAFGFEQDIDNAESPIAPLILLSLVENAFKHGASGAIQQPRIEISISVKDNLLKTRVFNTKPVKAQSDPNQYKEGIGVSNIKRQLELIYPDVYTLHIDEKADSYTVNLEIQLATL
jgi:LytS/YehU family sensor histidine kinase